MYRIVLILIVAQSYLLTIYGQNNKNYPVYFCDNAETLNEISQINVRRLFSRFSMVYIVLANKVIFFEMPILKKTGIKNEFGLVVYQPRFQEIRELDIGKHVIGYGSIGRTDNYSLLLTEQIVLELYLDQVRNKLDEQMRIIDFDRKIGSRESIDRTKLMMKIKSNMKQFNHQLISMNENYLKGYFVNYLLYDRNLIQIKINPNHEDNEQFDGQVKYCELLNDGECNRRTLKRSTFKLKHKMNKFTMIQRSFKEWEGKNLYLLVVDDENNVYVDEMKIGFSGTKMVVKEKNQIGAIRFDELFGCHRKYRDEREIKGIYYSRSTETFYLIINRYYLKIVNDPVPDGFYIHDTAFENPLSLKLASNSGYPTLEILKTKWVKTLRLNSYLVTHFDTFCFLNSNKFSLDDIYMYFEGNTIVKCEQNTLSIDDNVFCFTEEEYAIHSPESKLHLIEFYKPGTKFKIFEIFVNSPIEYGEDERLRYTFNYKNDKFVLMTTNYLYVLDYKRFKVNNLKQIVYNYESDSESLQIRNRFLANDVAVRTLKRRIRKVIRWIFIIVLLSIVGSFVYFYIKRRKSRLALSTNRPDPFSTIFYKLANFNRKPESPQPIMLETKNEGTLSKFTSAIDSVSHTSSSNKRKKSKQRSTSPHRSRSKSPHRSRSKSPHRSRSKSPHRSRSKSLRRSQSMSPHQSNSLGSKISKVRESKSAIEMDSP